MDLNDITDIIYIIIKAIKIADHVWQEKIRRKKKRIRCDRNDIMNIVDIIDIIDIII